MKKIRVKSQLIILVFILVLAAFFRFYHLGRVPPSPSLDEVSIGWNAYSILKTGQDEYGTKLPILLRAYDDWRPAIYVYLVIPFVKVLGLSAVAVRLPAALLSLLSVWLTYFLVKELFLRQPFVSYLALLASFLLAISPWHIYPSRLGHEVNLGLTFSLLAIYFFLRALNYQTPKSLFLSSLFFAFCFYTYQSLKIFTPLMILALGLIYRKKLLSFKKEVFLAGLLALILLLPIIKLSFTPQTMIRFQGTSIFANQPHLLQKASERVVRDFEKNNLLGLVFDNRRIALGLEAVRAYFSHFNPSWLFFNSGEEKHKVPGMGILYLWELPLILVGSYHLIKGKFSKKTRYLIFSWLFLSPLPASIATEAPHVMRTLNILPMPQLLTAIGVVSIMLTTLGASLDPRFRSDARSQDRSIINFFSSKRGWRWLLVAAILILSLNLSYFYHQYFFNFPYEQSRSFQYPLSQAINYAQGVEDQYAKIVFANHDHCFQSYMFFLYFSQYDPRLYLNQGGTASGGHGESHRFGKYEFRSIDWKKEKFDQRVLYVGNLGDFPKNYERVAVFQSLDGREALRAVIQKKVTDEEI